MGASQACQTRQFNAVDMARSGCLQQCLAAKAQGFGHAAVRDAGQSLGDRFTVCCHYFARMVQHRAFQPVGNLQGQWQHLAAVVRVAEHVEHHVGLGAQQRPVRLHARRHRVKMPVVAGAPGQVIDGGAAGTGGIQEQCRKIGLAGVGRPGD